MWHYSKDGTQYGPVDETALRAKLAGGEISPNDLVWRDGMRDWLPAGQVQEFAGGLPAVSPYQPPMHAGSRPHAVAPMGYAPPVPNYLWQSIVVTVLCCWPLGIPAIVYAAKVDGLRARGDIHGAIAASTSAKNWCLVSVGIWVLIMVLALLGGAFSSLSGVR